MDVVHLSEVSQGVDSDINAGNRDFEDFSGTGSEILGQLEIHKLSKYFPHCPRISDIVRIVPTPGNFFSRFGP